MYTKVHLLGDATEWTLTDADAATLLDAADHTAPVVVAVTAPVTARLIVSPHALGALAVQPVPPDTDWMPSYVTAPSAYLYLPSATGISDAALGYRLAAGTDLDNLENEVVAAMHGRHRIRVPLLGLPGNVLVLNGATVPLVALLPSA